MAEKVFVGLSGGVDSSLAAAYLLRQGYDVTGVFIKIWQPEFTECTWKEDRIAAKKSAVALGIPFQMVDLSEEYKDEVIKRMKDDYQNGFTPNPDVLCNKSIKFGAFKDWAKRNGAGLIATGHHAQIVNTNDGATLVRGKDKNKDQSYFLSQLSKEDLSEAIFPIGHLTKEEVRKEASKLNLPSANRPDSQGLCFVGDVDMHDFLKELLDISEGNVLDDKGEVIGTHDGAALYTIGQRHGFNIKQKSVDSDPFYVIDINTNQNTITVSNTLNAAMEREVTIDNANWISGSTPGTGKYTAQLRYRQKEQDCYFDENEKTKILFDEPQLVVKGQFLALYDGGRCLGGGVVSG